MEAIFEVSGEKESRMMIVDVQDRDMHIAVFNKLRTQYKTVVCLGIQDHFPKYELSEVMDEPRLINLK